MPILFAMDDHAKDEDEDYEVEENGHSLPESAEDMKITAGRAVAPKSIADRIFLATSQCGSRRNLMVAGIGAVVLIIVISVGVAVSNKKQASAASSPRMQQTTAFLSQVSDTNEHRNKNSPQYAAAHWIADTDSADIPSDPSSDDATKFLQRYALAVLYYATHGEHWVFDGRFLAKESECNWLEGFNMPDGKFKLGVTCNDVGHVKEIRLRK